MILIYSYKLTNRLKYIFKTIFTDILQVEINFTDNNEEFEQAQQPKINYSNRKLSNELFFQASSILFQKGITEQNITISKYEDYPCFFNVSKESIIPFDPFAASFYLISRYEEYLPYIQDEHERYTATESLAYKFHFLQLPLINIWAGKIAEIISMRYPNFKFPAKKFQYQSTIDIDNAFAFKHKGIIRQVLGLFKGVVDGNFMLRAKVLTDKEKDPFDTYEYQKKIHQKYNIQPLYFFLLGDYDVNDKNLSYKNNQFQSLIKAIADYNDVGIHPSYTSNKNEKKINLEIKRLKQITHQNITKSRQHFLKLNLPQTYRNLIENDIKEDYTMGYAQKCGFRASIASPFYFYDLDAERASNLKIIPFAIMEATLQYYENHNPEQAINEIKKMIDVVKSVKGTFVSVWHNESLSNQGIWKDWRNVYEQMLKAVTS